jgi:hypothetical protein
LNFGFMFVEAEQNRRLLEKFLGIQPFVGLRWSAW